MRIYANAYELMSEIFREVWEMGHIVHPHSMQNKIIKDDDAYSTKEIINYSYALTNLFKVQYLFFSDYDSREWADAEIEERVAYGSENPGEAYKLRSHIWNEFLNKNGQFDYTYQSRIRTQLDKIIGELGRNPDSRQAIVSVWDHHLDAHALGGKRRVPCSIYYQFLYRNKKLHIIYNQRSADVVTHFGNDVYLAWRLMEYVAAQLKVRPGHLFHNIASLHAYKKDWPKLKQCLEDIAV